MPRKLLLTMETLRHLSTANLHNLAAGNTLEPRDSFDIACSDLPDCATVGEFCILSADCGGGGNSYPATITYRPVSRADSGINC